MKSDILTWLEVHQNVLGWLGLISLVMMAVTLLAVPMIIVTLPTGYLNEDKDRLAGIRGIWRWPYLIVKNIFGGVLAVAGVAMLFLPGQGLLTLVIGLGLMNFPGKRSLVRRLIGQHRIFAAINRLRARAHKAPLEAPD